MTYGVPYSFVPGTKAKADEVNANFIDILNKIEDTNTRIDDANSQTSTDITNINSKIEEAKKSCLNLDLSNLSSTGKSVLNAKADASLLDGTWINKAATLCSGKTITANQTQTYSLSSYLPNDKNKYEVLVSLTADFIASSSSQAALYMYSDFITTRTGMIRHYSGVNHVTFSAAAATFISSTGRKISIYNSEYGVNATTYSIKVMGYRKVR